MKIYRTPVEVGETMYGAILRAATFANEQGYDGYEILCDICNAPVRDHDLAGDCQRFKDLREELRGNCRAEFVKGPAPKKPYTTPALAGPHALELAPPFEIRVDEFTKLSEEQLEKLNVRHIVTKDDGLWFNVVGRNTPAPRIPEVDLQMLVDAGFNAFGLQLFAESVANVRDRQPGGPDFKPFTFIFRNIKITLEPNGPVDTRHA